MSGFSSALKLTDLNDFIQPSQACVKPVETGAKKSLQNVSKNTGDEDGIIQINKSKSWKNRIKKEPTDSGDSVKTTKPLNVTLGDCLACSGCITSAEAVLIAEQSHEKVLEILETKKRNHKTSVDMVVVLTLSLQSIASLAAKYRLSMQDTAERLAQFFHELGVDFVFDVGLARHICLIESAKEFVRQHRSEGQSSSEHSTSTTGPLLSSTCPGFVCYAEKSQGSVLVPLLSRVKSPQQIMGLLVKQRLTHLPTAQLEAQLQLSGNGAATIKPSQVYHITLMPCYDKKLEASRNDNRIEGTIAEVDCVITPVEVEKMLEHFGGKTLHDFAARQLNQFSTKFTQSTETEKPELQSHQGSGSGGYAENIFRLAALMLYEDYLKDAPTKQLLQDYSQSLTWKTVRNADFLELSLYENGTTGSNHSGDARCLLSFAILNGFRNVQNLVSRLKRGGCQYHYVEVSACPKGCLNGGAQLRDVGSDTGVGSGKDPVLAAFEQSQALYEQLAKTKLDKIALDTSEQMNQIKLDQMSLQDMQHELTECEQIYRELNIDQQFAKQMRTQFSALEKTFSILNSNW